MSNYAEVALVTGASSGIGESIAVELAQHNYNVVIVGRHEERLAQVVSNHQQLVPFVADLSDFSQVDKLIEFVKTKFNRLDVLVNNVCLRGEVATVLDEKAVEELQRVLQINLYLPIYLIYKLLVPMKSHIQRNPIVVNISSSASKYPVRNLQLYSISKAALSELSCQLGVLADQLGFFSIAISPGPVLTADRPHHINLKPTTLLNRVADPKEISNCVMFVIENSHLFNGRELMIDGGSAVKMTSN